MAFNPPFITDGELGSLTDVFTVSKGDGYDNPPYAVGTLHDATDGSVWTYVLAATTINQNDTVAIDANGNASQITSALAAALTNRIGFCQVSGGIPSGSYGWVALRGAQLKATFLAGSTAAAATYTTATAGVLGTTASGQTAVYGVAPLTAPGGSNAAVAIATTFPRTLN